VTSGLVERIGIEAPRIGPPLDAERAGPPVKQDFRVAAAVLIAGAEKQDGLHARIPSGRTRFSGPVLNYVILSSREDGRDDTAESAADRGPFANRSSVAGWTAVYRVRRWGRNDVGQNVQRGVGRGTQVVGRRFHGCEQTTSKTAKTAARGSPLTASTAGTDAHFAMGDGAQRICRRSGRVSRYPKRPLGTPFFIRQMPHSPIQSPTAGVTAEARSSASAPRLSSTGFYRPSLREVAIRAFSDPPPLFSTRIQDLTFNDETSFRGTHRLNREQ
jgi:hypothetical protein